MFNGRNTLNGFFHSYVKLPKGNLGSSNTQGLGRTSTVQAGGFQQHTRVQTSMLATYGTMWHLNIPYFGASPRPQAENMAPCSCFILSHARSSAPSIASSFLSGLEDMIPMTNNICCAASSWLGCLREGSGKISSRSDSVSCINCQFSYLSLPPSLSRSLSPSDT